MALALLLGACGDGSPPSGGRVGEGGVVEGGVVEGGAATGGADAGGAGAGGAAAAGGGGEGNTSGVTTIRKGAGGAGSAPVTHREHRAAGNTGSLDTSTQSTPRGDGKRQPPPRAEGKPLMQEQQAGADGNGPNASPLKQELQSQGGAQGSTQSTSEPDQQRLHDAAEPYQDAVGDLAHANKPEAVRVPVDYVAITVPTVKLTISDVAADGKPGNTSRPLTLLVDPSSSGVHVFRDAVAGMGLAPLAIEHGKNHERADLAALTSVRGSRLWGAVTRAHVTFGGVTTQQPVPLQLVGLANLPRAPGPVNEANDTELMKFAQKHKIDGILGIGPSAVKLGGETATSYFACIGKTCGKRSLEVGRDQQLAGLGVVLAQQQGLVPAIILSPGRPGLVDHAIKMEAGTLTFGVSAEQWGRDYGQAPITHFSDATAPLGQLHAAFSPSTPGFFQLPWANDAGIDWGRLLEHKLMIVGPSDVAKHGGFLLEKTSD